MNNSEIELLDARFRHQTYNLRAIVRVLMAIGRGNEVPRVVQSIVGGEMSPLISKIVRHGASVRGEGRVGLIRPEANDELDGGTQKEETTVQVAALIGGARVELQTIAVKP